MAGTGNRVESWDEAAVCSRVVLGTATLVAFKKPGPVTFETRIFMLHGDYCGALLLHFYGN